MKFRKAAESRIILPSFLCLSCRDIWASPCPLSGEMRGGQEQRTLRPRGHHAPVQEGLPRCVFSGSHALFRHDRTPQPEQSRGRKAGSVPCLAVPCCSRHPNSKAPFPSVLKREPNAVSLSGDSKWAVCKLHKPALNLSCNMRFPHSTPKGVQPAGPCDEGLSLTELNAKTVQQPKGR